MTALRTSGLMPLPRNSILHGDCIALMDQLPPASVDLIVTDPPYLVNYRSRDGLRVANDNNADWLHPSAVCMYRLLKPGGFCVSFYGWTKADLFIDAWRKAGFHIVGHIVFRKRYASSMGFLRAHHEMAYLLAKGPAVKPAQPIPNVIDFPYTGNRLHPTQKPVEALQPLIASFSKPGDVVLDPFCGSGSTLVAAHALGREWLGIELDQGYHRIACSRLA